MNSIVVKSIVADRGIANLSNPIIVYYSLIDSYEGTRIASIFSAIRRHTYWIIIPRLMEVWYSL